MATKQRITSFNKAEISNNISLLWTTAFLPHSGRVDASLLCQWLSFLVWLNFRTCISVYQSNLFQTASLIKQTFPLQTSDATGNKPGVLLRHPFLSVGSDFIKYLPGPATLCELHLHTSEPSECSHKLPVKSAAQQNMEEALYHNVCLARLLGSCRRANNETWRSQ